MSGRLRRNQVAGMNLMYKWYSFDYFLDSMERLGFERIALWGGPPHFQCDYLTYDDCRKLDRKIKKKKLEISSFLVTSTNYRYQIATEEREHFEKCYQYFRNGILACEELGCSSMSCNSGWGYFNHDREDAWKRSCDMLGRLSQEAENRGIILTMESLKPIETNLVTTIREAKQMYDEVHHPAFKIMVDTGAAAYQGETLQQWFDVFGEEIKAMHFVDSMHKVWGEGNLNLQTMVETITRNSYQGTLALETSGSSYFRNPYQADKKNMEALEPFFEE